MYKESNESKKTGKARSKRPNKTIAERGLKEEVKRAREREREKKKRREKETERERERQRQREREREIEICCMHAYIYMCVAVTSIGGPQAGQNLQKSQILQSNMTNRNRHKIVRRLLCVSVLFLSSYLSFPLVSPYCLLFHDILEPQNSPTSYIKIERGKEREREVDVLLKLY